MDLLIDQQKVTAHHEDDRPLGEVERRIIDSNRYDLNKEIDLNSAIIERLFSNKCFTEQHKEFIESGTTKSKKVNNFLDIVRRGSVGNFKKLASALYRDGQQQLARLLLQGGGMCVITLFYNVTISLTHVRIFLFF